MAGIGYVKNNDQESLELVDVSESTLRRAIREGELSATKDEKGRNLIDPAELERVYGRLKPVNEQVNDNEMAGNDTAKVVDLLEVQVSDLKSQLEQSAERERQLMDMLKIEQEKSKMLLLPKPCKRTLFEQMSDFWGIVAWNVPKRAIVA